MEIKHKVGAAASGCSWDLLTMSNAHHLCMGSLGGLTCFQLSSQQGINGQNFGYIFEHCIALAHVAILGVLEAPSPSDTTHVLLGACRDL